MPSLGRKFLMAGKSGLNLTHSEPMDVFLSRFGDRAEALAPALHAFDNQAVRDWAAGLGIETFIGSSGRVFPTEFKAAPLLRAWLSRMRAKGLKTHTRHRWVGWTAAGQLSFEAPGGVVSCDAGATILALGGASWPQLGSDGTWYPLLQNRGAAVTPFRPANVGFDIDWSDHFRSRFAGEPVKAVTLSAGSIRRQGEFVITETGIEGSGVYAVSAPLRDQLDQDGSATLMLDLTPDRSRERLVAHLAKGRSNPSFSDRLRRATGLSGVKAGLLRECLDLDTARDPMVLASAIKALPLRLLRPRPLSEAISSAGGLSFDAVQGTGMIRALPGVFATGEMLDWEAPTGGYLLTACFALGRAVGLEAADYLQTR